MSPFESTSKPNPEGGATPPLSVDAIVFSSGSARPSAPFGPASTQSSSSQSGQGFSLRRHPMDAKGTATSPSNRYARTTEFQYASISSTNMKRSGSWSPEFFLMRRMMGAGPGIVGKNLVESSVYRLGQVLNGLKVTAFALHSEPGAELSAFASGSNEWCRVSV